MCTNSNSAFTFLEYAHIIVRKPYIVTIIVAIYVE